MKLSNSFFSTLREDVKDEDSKSGNLLVRGGYVKKTSAGVYMFLPLGLRVVNKIEAIVRKEMEAIHSNEMMMPTLIAEDVYIASGRRDIIGTSMFNLRDRYQKPFVLGPTHEELFAQAAALHIKSYKDMPLSLFQFQTKFRDEARPRFGLIRVREFVMKDAYTFDLNEAAGDKSYADMFQAYKNIFDTIGLDYRVVKADTGIMGGLLSEEFQAISPIGEDVLVLGDDFASNLEIAENVNRIVDTDEYLETTKVHTPNAKTIEEVANFLELPVSKFVKTLIYKCDETFVAVCVLGNRDVNETKLGKLVQANEVELADFGSVVELTGAGVGFVGPQGLSIDVYVDSEIEGLRNFIVGANEDDYHMLNANFKDMNIKAYADISEVVEGDPNPNGNGVLHFAKGIEVGNTFKLGTTYAQAMNLEYLDQNQKLQDVFMGSYGIGIGRTIAALVEQNNDDNGIAWPLHIAPYQVAIVIVNTKNEDHVAFATDLYDELKKAGLDVLLDDRPARAGVKFNDIELIGIPLRITIGRDVENNEVEFKVRSEEESTKLNRDLVKDHILALIK